MVTCTGWGQLLAFRVINMLQPQLFRINISEAGEIGRQANSRRSWKFRLALIDLDFERIYFTFFPLLFLRSLKEKKNSTIILKVMIARKILYNSAEHLAHISCLRLCPTVGNKDTGIGSRFFATFLQFPRIIVHYRSIEVPGLSLFLL